MAVTDDRKYTKALDKLPNKKADKDAINILGVVPNIVAYSFCKCHVLAGGNLILIKKNRAIKALHKKPRIITNLAFLYPYTSATISPII